MSNVIYLGHIPDGFVENDMWKYLGQFGAVKKLKLFRSKKTGRSKGFAFIQFLDDDVAKIVASTMNNYLMFDKIMKCHVIPKEKIHKNMFKNWQKIRRPASLTKKMLQKRNKTKTDAQILSMRQRLATQIEKQNKKLADFGINYSFPVTWAKVKGEVKDEIKEETDSIDESFANDTEEIFSEYSMIVDSSDDEVALRTPEQAVKRTKMVETPKVSEKTSKPKKSVPEKKKNVVESTKSIEEDKPAVAVVLPKKVRFSLGKSVETTINTSKNVGLSPKTILKQQKPKATKKKFKIKKILSKKDKARNKGRKMFKR